MNTEELTLHHLNADHADRIVELVQLLNPSLTAETLHERLAQQWGAEGYHCVGLFKNDRIIGLASAWVTLRLYGGKVVEFDNIVVDPAERGGTGTQLLALLEERFRALGYHRFELKTYAQNTRSHKFYYNNGYKIRAFYFAKGDDFK